MRGNNEPDIMEAEHCIDLVREVFTEDPALEQLVSFVLPDVLVTPEQRRRDQQRPWVTVYIHPVSISMMGPWRAKPALRHFTRRLDVVIDLHRHTLRAVMRKVRSSLVP